jgi:hypothetical protein
MRTALVTAQGHQFKEDEMGGECGTYGEAGFLLKEPEGKRPLG